MKIALVSPYDFAYPGGVNAHITHLAGNFLRQGHQVRILAPASNYEHLPLREHVVVIGRPFGIPASGSVARIALSLLLSRPVRAVLREEQFDVVHLHEPLVPALPITVLRFSQAVNVGTFHASHPKSRIYSYTRRLLKHWFHKLDGKTAVSPAAARFISRYFPGYYNIIPNGIDVHHFTSEVAPLEAFADGRPNLLFVGRMEKRKGLRYLLGAYARLKESYPQLRLLVVGPEDRAAGNYHRLVERAGLRDVHFLGYVPYEEMPRYYRTADIFCAPATGGESFGIVLLEAMAVGCPVVASDIEGYASVVGHGQEGLLVPSKDEGALAEAIARLLEDGTLRERLGMAGQAKAQGYSWEKVSHQVMAYYQRLLGERSPRQGESSTGGQWPQAEMASAQS